MITLFGSSNPYTYYVNLELFYDVAIWCTVVYFVFACWDLRRSKALHRSQTQAEVATAA
jgi:hypothetical protein